MEECKPKCLAVKLLVVGLVLILAKLYTAVDMWLVVGGLFVVKGLLLFLVPKCPCSKKK